MLQESVEAVRLQRAVAAPLAHIVYEQQLLLVAEHIQQTGCTVNGQKFIVSNFVAGACFAQFVQLRCELEYLLFEFGNFCGCHAARCYDCGFPLVVSKYILSISSGTGNTIVFVLSFDISLSVCR